MKNNKIRMEKPNINKNVRNLLNQLKLIKKIVIQINYLIIIKKQNGTMNNI